MHKSSILAIAACGLLLGGCDGFIFRHGGPLNAPAPAKHKVAQRGAADRDPKSPDVRVAPPADQVLAPVPDVKPEPRVVVTPIMPGVPIKPTKAECTARADKMKWRTAIGKYWRIGRWRWIRKCMKGEA